MARETKTAQIVRLERQLAEERSKLETLRDAFRILCPEIHDLEMEVHDLDNRIGDVELTVSDLEDRSGG